MKTVWRCVWVLALAAISGQALAELVLYGREDFRGRNFTADRRVGNLERFGFNDRASSAVVRGGRWEVCTEARFEGNCVVLRRGRYPSLHAMGLNDRITSVRPLQRQARVDEQRFAPQPPAPVYDRPRW